MRSDDLLKKLADLHPRHIDLSLGRMRRLMRDLGDPQTRLSPMIHIAGTNGKGSVYAYLTAMLRAGGARVHGTSSPHLVRFHERIMLDGRDIDEDALVSALDHILRINGDAPITFFEAVIAAAFYAFAQKPADYIILETGLGGRLDATNIITPRLCIITMIDHDHHEFLGDSLAKIAGEKAGILKPFDAASCAAIIAPQAQPALDVLEAHAANHNVPLSIGGRDWHVEATADSQSLIFSDAAGALTLPLPALAGAHQYINAGCAIAAARALDISPAAIAQGLQQAVWAGRLQNLAHIAIGRDFAKSHPQGELWLDGGHNPAAARALSTWIASQWIPDAPPPADAAPIHIICGLLAQKSARDFLSAFAALDIEFHMIRIAEHISHAPHDLVALARQMNIRAQAHEVFTDALDVIVEKNARVLICGSLYLAGQVLAYDADG